MDEIYNLQYTLFYSSILFLLIGFIGNVHVGNTNCAQNTRDAHAHKLNEWAEWAIGLIGNSAAIVLVFKAGAFRH